MLAWLLNDVQSAAAEGMIRRGLGEGAAAPALLELEVGNGLRSSVRRRRLSIVDRDAALADFARLPIVRDTEATIERIVAVSDQFDLTVYDAAYLELAMRTGSTLATFDDALRNAANRCGVALA